MRKRKQIKVKPKTKKAFAGALISTGLSFLGGLAANRKQKFEQQEAHDREVALAKASNMEADKIRLEDFKAEGEGEVDYYALAKGGKIKGKRKDIEKQKELDAKYLKASKEAEKGIKQKRFKKKLAGFVAKDEKLLTKKVKDNSYANGGNISQSPSYSSKGGELKPLSSDMEIAKGKKHSQGGIDLLDANGKPFVEIEGDETIKDGTKVYSDQTLAPNGKTYAENAEALAKKKAKVEKNINSGDKITRNTAKRKAMILDQQEDALFAHQEANKTEEEKVTVKASKGMNFKDTKFGKTLAGAIPYLDNVTNTILTATSPKVKDPVLQKVTPLKTKYNAQGQLDDVDRAVDAAATNIKNNTSNSANARAETTAARLAGSRQKASIRANKENIETSLHNANVQNAQNITARNLVNINQTQDKRFARSSDIQSRISANVADAAGDFIDKRNFDAEQDYNKERLDIARQTDIAGTSLRADLLNPTEINKLKTDPVYAAEQRKRYLNNPKELAKFDAIINGKSLAVPNLNN